MEKSKLYNFLRFRISHNQCVLIDIFVYSVKIACRCTIVFSRNIFYTAEPSCFNFTQSTDNVFSGNWYLGTYASLPNDPEAKTSCPLYEEQILSAGRDGYRGLEKLMTQRNVCGTPFLFIDRERIEAFFAQLD